MTIEPAARLSTDLSDLDWFDAFCRLLRRDEKPTRIGICNLLGTPDDNLSRESLGALFLQPFDPRFSYVWVNRGVDDPNGEVPIKRIGLRGPPFALRVRDVLDRFPERRIKLNTYDGGYQHFFHPVPQDYEFSALAVATDLEDSEDPVDLVVDNVRFYFGDILVESRVGFAMRR